MMKKMMLSAVLFGLGFTWAMPNNTSFAAEQSVPVTLPKFNVKLNGITVENEYRKYPLLVYKDITYVPMTWYDTRLLGLESTWNPSDGLAIEKGDVTSAYEPYPSSNKNPATLKATIRTGEVKINGKTVDNSDEEFPLLSYNDVTYFPLTWRFAHDEFGWEYVWINNKGLSIHSHNPQPETLAFPARAMFGGYYYFVESEGITHNVYRMPESNKTQKELVYSYEADYSNLTFEIRENELWLKYHLGGGLMGSDYYTKVQSDGKAKVMHHGYLDFRNTPRGELVVNQGVPPFGNNLQLAGTNIGNPNLIYGWHVQKTDASNGLSSDGSTTVVGDDVFIMASDYPYENGQLNNIYKLSLTTGKTAKVVHDKLAWFKVANEILCER